MSTAKGGKLVTQVLNEIRGGVFVNAASKELGELVERIQEAGKGGSLTITLKITPHGKNNREMHVTPSLKVSAPPSPDTTEAGIFYAKDGDLVRDDPDQTKLPFGNKPVTVVAGDGTSG